MSLERARQLILPDSTKKKCNTEALADDSESEDADADVITFIN